MSASSSGKPSRRSVLIGSAAAVVLVGVGVPTGLVLSRPKASDLVTTLVGSKRFTAAHRGGSADWPEMSERAYRESVAHGVEALEMSVARSSDGVWFGLHDTTLDRTSGTTGFVAADHTWAEIATHLITLKPTDGPNEKPQPYYRFDDLVEAYAATHTIFVDPKAVESTYYPELLKLLQTRVSSPEKCFIAKSYCTATKWGQLAQGAGIRSWGFYYASEIAADPTLLPKTQAAWDLLGLDWSAPEKAWSSVEGYGKTVIAHVIPDRAAAEHAFDRGAHGVMISGIAQTLPL